MTIHVRIAADNEPTCEECDHLYTPELTEIDRKRWDNLGVIGRCGITGACKFRGRTCERWKEKITNKEANHETK
jgi:hypothetical protein